jgi:hypothetical protein
MQRIYEVIKNLHTEMADFLLRNQTCGEDPDILFQVISKRSEMLPTIVTTNLPPKEWGAIFSGAAASAILDRLSFNGRFITFEATVMPGASHNQSQRNYTGAFAHRRQSPSQKG